MERRQRCWSSKREKRFSEPQVSLWKAFWEISWKNTSIEALTASPEHVTIEIRKVVVHDE
jgi:hypothetical protein